MERKERNFFILSRFDRRFSSRTCHHISRNIVSPFFSVGPRDPCYPRISLASCLPHFRHHGGQCPPFFPLIAPPFLYSSTVGKRISLDDVWTTWPRVYSIDRGRREGGSFIPDEKKESYLALVIGRALDSVVRTRRTMVEGKGVGR